MIGAAQNLLPPSVKEANGPILNPVQAKDALHIVVPANAALLPDDKLKVTWTGAAGTPAGGSHTSGEWPVRDGWEVPIPNSVVAFNLGKAVTVTYTVIQNGVESPPSDTFTLNVQAMPVASLPMPLIPEAAQGGIGTELDLNTFTGHARVTVAPWPLIAVDQRVWLKCEGTTSDGSDYTIPLYIGSEVTSGQVAGGLSTTLSRSELEKLRDGSELKVVLLVTFNRTNNQSEAVTFPLRIYTLRTLAETLHSPSVEGVSEGGVLDPSQAQVWTRVPGDALLVDDKVVVIWTDKNGAVAEYRSPAKPYTSGDISNNYLRFLIPSADIQRFVGTDVRVTYLRDRNGNITGPSLAFNMSVGVPVPVAFPSFTNEPYRTVPGGQLKDIILLLSHEGGAPVSNGKVTLNLPSGFTYADGASGSRQFTTGSDGTATVSGVKGHTVPNVYNLIATSGSQSATAPVTIAALELIDSISVRNPMGVAVRPDGAYLYVCNYDQGQTVSVIDAATGRMEVPIWSGLNPVQVAVSPNGSRGYFTANIHHLVVVFDMISNQMIDTVAVPQPYGIAVSSDSSRVYACRGANSNVNAVVVIDTATTTIAAVIPMPAIPRRIAISQVGNFGYVCSQLHSTVAVIDTATNRILTNIQVGDNPKGVAISPDGRRAYICNTDSHTVSVIETATHRVLVNIPVGNSPNEVVVSPDNTRAYVCGVGNASGIVWVIDTATNVVLTSTLLEAGPTGIAVSPNGTRIYVSLFSSNKLLVLAAG
ncbi:40-residue YVTN family beta-propeller repeat-containing protein [Pseudomonas sp. NFACC49-2]|nr:40-residue YVTN family beta-propeller repeat-containing protein [Pseudomonas sp. NFACC49-2]